MQVKSLFSRLAGAKDHTDEDGDDDFNNAEAQQSINDNFNQNN